MKKKRGIVVSLFLAISMFAFLLAGCGSNGTKQETANSGGNGASNGEATAKPNLSDETTKISFWVLFDGSDADTMRNIVDEYNKANPKHTIDLQFVDNAQYYTKLKTGILGGNGPDLAISHIGGYINGMVNDKIILPLDDAAKKFGVDISFDKYSKGPTEEANINGKQYAAPLDNLARVLMYNKSILKDAGLLDSNGKPNFNDDYAGFTGALQKIKDSNPKVTPLTMTMKPPQLVLTWLSIYYQLGGQDFLNIANKKASFDDNKAIEALTKLHEIYTKYVPEKLTDPAGMDMFKAKQAAFYIDGTWNVYASAKPLGDDFGVMGFPHLFGNAEVTTSQAFILPKKDSRTDAQTKAALEFVKWFADNNWKWALAGHIPAYQPSMQTSEFKGLPYQSGYSDPSRKVVPLPVIPGTMLHTAPEVKDQIQLAVLGQTSPEDAVKNIRKNLDNLIPQLVP